jgi:hypothetical protein
MLTAASGALGGVYLARGWRNWDWRIERLRRAEAFDRATTDSAQRAKDPEQWRRDSAEQAVARLHTAGRPREIGRSQVAMHCVVNFEFRDSTYQAQPLFTAEAWARGLEGKVIAAGYTYKPDGFRRGDTARVVLPNVYCSDIVISGWSGGTALPARPLQLYIR